VRFSWILVFVVLTALPVLAKDSKPEAAKIVDSGTFSIMVSGREVAKETFQMEQTSGVNVVTSELSAGTGNGNALQKAVLEISPTGDLRRYTWQEINPSKSQVVVEPQDANFLIERVTVNSDSNSTKDFTHPLSRQTSILDDNFFSHLEVLAWRYMAMGCHPTSEGMTSCDLKPQKIAILVPHQQQSMLVVMEYVGQQKLNVAGKVEDYMQFKMRTEAGDWDMWMDSAHRLVRIVIPDENTEVVRN